VASLRCGLKFDVRPRSAEGMFLFMEMNAGGTEYRPAVLYPAYVRTSFDHFEQ